MARTDAIVLGAGIVGTSVALHLAKRGLSVALVDRRGPGEETCYGNAGVIVGERCFRPLSARLKRSCRSRSSGRRRRIITVGPAAGRAVAGVLSRQLAAPESWTSPKRCGR